MKRRDLALWGAALGLSISSGEAVAQTVLKPFRNQQEVPVRRAEPAATPEVRRAQPLAPAAPVATPQVRRAQPAEPLPPPVQLEPETEPVPTTGRNRPNPRRGRSTPEPARKPFRTQPAAMPAPTATPAPTAAPVTAQPAKPAAPAAEPAPTPPMPEPADPGTIRLSPNAPVRTADEQQIAVADSYWSRGLYREAAPEYQRYTELYPGGPDIAAATFRLAECYRKTGALNQARATYDILLTRFQVGDFVGPAAYFMADLLYQEKNYASALPYYRKAYLRLKEPAVVNAAKFFAARCLEAMGGAGNKLEAGELYRDLADTVKDNPFADASRMSYALLMRDAGRISEALKQVQLLAKQTTLPGLKVEATVRGGIWMLESGQNERAAEELKKALEMPNIGEWREVAQLGLLRSLYDAGKYTQVLAGFKENAESFSADRQPELLLLGANSYRQTDKIDQALPLYNRLLKEYPNSPYAQEAAYQRLVCLHHANDPALVAEIDVFLTTKPDERKRDQVQLMKAESLYKKEDYAGAAPMYEKSAESTELPLALRGEAMFKLGWCYMQTRNFEAAVKSYTQFIDRNPTHKNSCAARVQRGVAQQSLKNLTAAEKDYLEVIRRYKDCPEREFALQQEAVIRGQLNDNAGMAQHFETLLRDYPKSAAGAQANYWIGRANFDLKNYQKAVPALQKAREADKAEYFERATLPLMLCFYYLEDKPGLAREIETYRKDGKGKVPVEVLRWLAEQQYEAKNWAEAEKQFSYVAEREEVAPRDLLKLGQAQLRQEKYQPAVQSLQRYSTVVKEPLSQAMGLLELGRAQIGLKQFPAAQKTVEQILSLQPEGKLSGEARILSGDVLAAEGRWEEAAKLYTSVALILDDEEVTPRALERAVGAYREAGKEPEAAKTENTLKSRYPEWGRVKP